MKRWLLLLSLIILPALAAAGTWDQVMLFDWVYPGEANYELLKTAATQAGHGGWLAERFNKGEKIPQASARELAGRLWDDEKVDADTQAKLKEAFKDEPQQLSDGKGLETDRLDALSKSLDTSARRLDDFEASLERNRYGKGSTPAVNMDMYGAYRLDAPAGMVTNDTHGYLFGGLNVTLLGTLDKANFTLGIGGRYFYGADSAPFDASDREGTTTVGASFQMPLGEGGLEVHLGELVDVYLSSLLQSSIFLKDRDAFFVDVSSSYRAPLTMKALDLDYPAFTKQFRGLYIRRQGAEWYWPFSVTQVLYSPEMQFYDDFTNHTMTSALRVDEDLTGLASWLEVANVFYMVQRANNDEDQLRQEGWLTAPNARTIQGALAQDFGWDIHASWGTELHGEFSSSHFESKTVTASVARVFDDTAWYAVLSQPVGPLKLAVEGGAAGPHYLTGPETNDRIQPGAVLDTTSAPYFPGGPAYPNDYVWNTVIREPSVLSNNSERLVLKAEYHLSFLSIGLFDGAMFQQVTSTAFVAMTPFIEGHDFNGFGWFKVFGQTYALPTVSAAAPPIGAALYAQRAFNYKTASPAVYNSTGSSKLVNWQEMSQLGYKTVELTTLLSQGGIGDNHVMDDSLKSLNYAGGNLLFDLASLFERDLPLDLSLLGEVRDLAPNPGAPTFGPGNLFNQQIAVGFLNAGLTPQLTFLGMAGYETWKTDHSFYPLNMQVREFGVGFDWKLDPVVSGLQLNFRSTMMNYEDLNISSRELSLWTLGVASTLSY